MTDGSILGDLGDENSPRHAAAQSLWSHGFERLPDLQAQPGGNFVRGDICKVRGEMYIYDTCWWHWKVLVARHVKPAKKIPSP